MNKKIIIAILCLLSMITIYFSTGLKTITAYPEQPYRLTVLLMPLDSRPACTNFVVALGKIANIKVIVPPSELLDNYQQPGNKQALINWLQQESSSADYAIISTDMLIHGGLLNSRLASGSVTDEDNAIIALQNLHNTNPALKLFVFNIIPRLWLPDNNSVYQQQILEYSKLKDKAHQTKSETDLISLQKLEQTIPSDIINSYNALFERNYQLNLKLLQLLENKVISSLVIGQDDGQQYGISNIIKQKLYLAVETLTTKDNVNITRGTDEVALSMLGQIIGKNTPLKVKVIYNNDDSANIIMPYMPHSVDKTIQEKLKITNLQRVDNDNEADFILFVNIGTSDNKVEQEQSSTKIKELLKTPTKVALVDLSQHFSATETLLPTLIQNNININQLIAYAGWNTTSNSIGTALTQSLAFLSEQKVTTTLPYLKLLYKNNLTFLVSRFYEDYYYLKEIQPKLSQYLTAQNIDPAHLKDNYPLANNFIIKELSASHNKLSSSKSFQQEIHIDFNRNGQQNKYQLKIIDNTITAKLPWERIFEVNLQTDLTLSGNLEN